jgi:hypothetical protein
MGGNGLVGSGWSKLRKLKASLGSGFAEAGSNLQMGGQEIAVFITDAHISCPKATYP